jgi:hypothetical protein
MLKKDPKKTRETLSLSSTAAGSFSVLSDVRTYGIVCRIISKLLYQLKAGVNMRSATPSYHLVWCCNKGILCVLDVAC